ncbi:PREDICTED: mucin-5AC-like [Branchiostoma belcheri]|uniref:Mucin-5AC-like n=1 Tax=Branchiostoma belcheri TaxID=7741 RepID=A0A6P4ZFG2_BRABE|nr:PREDICTED: mucin-5AC-like [Branchiostoma belcheri]
MLNLQYAEADRNIKFTLQGRSLKDMLELNKVHPDPAPQVLPTYSVSEEKMTCDDNHELGKIPKTKEEPGNITNIESQLKERTSRCTRRRIIFSVAVGVFIVIAVTVPVVCLTVGCPPSNNTTSNGTMDHLHVTILTTFTSSPRTTSNTINPGSSQQPVSETSHPPTTSTSKAETSQQTQGNTTSSDTDPTTTTTQAKSCSDQNLFECNSTGECISRELRCNGINDCVPDGEDEKNCPGKTNT